MRGRCDFPNLQLAFCSVLCSNGRAVACGTNDHDRCNVPGLDDGVMYSRVYAGAFYTMLHRNDGHAVAAERMITVNATF
jgi:hypothetical protein